MVEYCHNEKEVKTVSKLSENNERIYVTVSKELAKRIDYYRSKMGLSRSAYCAYLVGQGVMTTDKAMGFLDDLGEAVREKVTSSMAQEENGIQALQDPEKRLTTCLDCENDCKDENDPAELAYCEKFRQKK